jgi:signal transduction histidine kinase
MRRVWWIKALVLWSLGNLAAASKEVPLEISSRYLYPAGHEMPPKKAWIAAQELALGESIDLDFNHHNSAWISLKIHNPNPFSVYRILALPNIHLDSVECYENGELWLLGDETPSTGPYLGNIGFRLNFAPKEIKTIYLRLRKDRSFLDFQLNLESPSALEAHTAKWTLGYAFFSSLVLVIIAINALLWAQTKERIYRQYLIAAAMSLVYMTVNTGMGKFALFPTATFFSELRIYSGLLWFAAISPFIRTLLKTEVHFPFVNRLLFGLNGLFVGIIAASSYLLVVPDSQHTEWFMGTGYAVYVVLVASHAALCIRHFWIHPKYALFAVTAFLPLKAYGIFHVLHMYNLTNVALPRDFLALSALFEAFLFGILLANNYVQAFRNERKLQHALIVAQEATVQVALETQLRERTSIAHALHDQFGGTLAALLHQARQTPSTPLVQGLDALASDLRSMAHALMPRALEEGALVSALQNQLEIVQSQSGVRCELHSFDAPENVPHALAKNLYLIALELIQNAIKHGRAPKVVVEVFGYPDRLVLQVVDNGIGFDPASTPDGFGWQSIRSRVHGLHGEIDRTSQPGEGTSVLIHVPLEGVSL